MDALVSYGAAGSTSHVPPQRCDPSSNEADRKRERLASPRHGVALTVVTEDKAISEKEPEVSVLSTGLPGFVSVWPYLYFAFHRPSLAKTSISLSRGAGGFATVGWAARVVVG